MGNQRSFFNGKVAAITGAGSGIGRGLAHQLAQRGCDVAISDVNPEALQIVNDELDPYGVTVMMTQVDVSNRDEVEAWASQVMADMGQVNFVFNNAGVALGSTVEGVSYEDLEWLMDINFWGVVYGTKAFLPFIKQSVDASGKGHVVNISSLFGLTAQATQSAYNASKFAVRGFTESLRQELDIQNCGVSATCVHPGGIRTNIANAARMSDSLIGIGIDREKSSKQFNKLLRYPAEQAAIDILAAVETNKRRLLIGQDAKILDLVQRLAPSGYQRLFALATKYGSR